MKKIIFNNMTTLDKQGNKFVKLIKNFNCEFNEGSIISFISEDYGSKRVITELILGNKLLAKGKMNIPENTFPSFVSKNLNVKNMTASYYLLKNFKNNKGISKDLIFKKKKLNEELTFLNSRKNKIESQNEYEKILSGKNNFAILQWISLYNVDVKKYIDFNIEKKLLEDKIKKLDLSSIKDIKIYKQKIKYSGYYFASKEISILENSNKKIKILNNNKKLEIEEIKKLSLQNSPNIEQQKEIYKKLKVYSKKVIKYLKEIKIPGFILSDQELGSFSALLKEKDQREWLLRFDKITNLINKISPFLNSETREEIKIISNCIKNIKNHESPLNSIQFNSTFKKLIDDLNLKIKYYKKIDENIDENIDKIIQKDKNEKNFIKRKLWEFQIVSLRFQKQIFSEKIVVVNNHLGKVQNSFFMHDKKNIEYFYLLIKQHEITMANIDSSLNNWRYQRDIKEINLNKEIKCETNDFLKKKIENKLYNIQNISARENKSRVNLLINEYKSLSNSSISKHKLFKEFKNGIKEFLKEINNEIKEKENKLSLLLKKIESLTEENKEFEMMRILEEISFDMETLGDSMLSMTIGDIQRLQITSSVMNGSKIIIIDEPETDIELNTKISVQNAIKKISKNHGVTFFILTRNLKSVIEYSNVIAFLERGTVWEYGNPKTIMNNILHPISKDIIINAEKIRFMKKGQKFVEIGAENLLHNKFSHLHSYELSKDHNIFCTSEELKKWGLENEN